MRIFYGTLKIAIIYAEIRDKISQYYTNLWNQTKLGFPNNIEMDERKFTSYRIPLPQENNLFF